MKTEIRTLSVAGSEIPGVSYAETIPANPKQQEARNRETPNGGVLGIGPSNLERVCDLDLVSSNLVPTPPVAGISTQRGRLDRTYFRRVAELGIQAAEALDHAHTLGIVHRDVKPANLLVDGSGKLWVTDFGLAHIQSDARLTITGDLVGTLRYMSPEQALAKRIVVDHRTDVYSLGATLYELLTLEPAFGGSDGRTCCGRSRSRSRRRRAGSTRRSRRSWRLVGTRAKFHAGKVLQDHVVNCLSEAIRTGGPGSGRHSRAVEHRT